MELNSTKKEDFLIDLKQNNAEEKIMQSLLKNRFCILTNHDIPIHLLSEIYSEWGKFFDNPDKIKWLRSDEYDEGYVPIGVEYARDSGGEPDHKEFYQIHNKNKLPLPTSVNMTSTQILVDAIAKLSTQIITIIDKKIPSNVQKTMSESLTSMITGHQKHAIRVIHYPPLPYITEKTRAGSHGDVCLLTIIPAPTHRGLEFVDDNGGSFEPFCAKSDIIVFNSDMMELCTNGYLKSAKHMVTMHSDTDIIEARYSMPFFVHPRREVILNAEYNAFEFLKERLSEIGYIGEKLKE